MSLIRIEYAGYLFMLRFIVHEKALNFVTCITTLRVIIRWKKNLLKMYRALKPTWISQYKYPLVQFHLLAAIAQRPL